MTNSDAIEYLETIIYDDTNTAEMDEAIEMAIEALSNTPNTLEALGITDKQINMAIGAIIHILTMGYYSEDIEDALNALIRVLTGVK